MRARDLDTVYYFSYGHNTHGATMKSRAPRAKNLGPATLYNFRLAFEKFANIEHEAGAQVQGVLYQLPRQDLQHLDRDERVREHYARVPLQVHQGDHDYRAFVYIMEPSWHPGIQPSREYLTQVQQGYAQNHLPQSQIDQALERLQARHAQFK